VHAGCLLYFCFRHLQQHFGRPVQTDQDVVQPHFILQVPLIRAAPRRLDTLQQREDKSPSAGGTTHAQQRRLRARHLSELNEIGHIRHVLKDDAVRGAAEAAPN
jgi:hypothetical protein